MRVTRQNKRGCSRKHNDRNFATEKALHLNPQPAHENIYGNIYGDDSLTFEEVERRFYEEHFRHMLDERNQKCIDRREKKRIWTMEQFMSATRYSPENTLFQVGNKDEHIDTNLTPIYTFIRNDTEAFIKQKYGRLPYQILDYAIHYDETTPHVHERKVWIYHDEQGRECIGQEKALEEIGVPLPNPDLPVSRTNNRKMVFDAEILSLTQTLLQQFGYDIETEPIPERRTRPKNCDLERYIREQNKSLIEANRGLVEANRSLESGLKDSEGKIKIAEDHLRQSEQKAQEAEERLRRISIKTEQAETIIRRAESVAGRWEQATFLDKSAKKQMTKQQLREEYNLENPYEDFDR